MKIHNKPAIIFFILLLSAFFLIGCNTNENQNNTLSFETIATGSTEPDDVLVELTPLGVNNGILSVEIGVNTHSVGLEQFDLMELTTLNIGGKQVKPSKAPQLSGHHTSGVLEFAVGNKGNGIKDFTITIIEIPKEENRIFKWE